MVSFEPAQELVAVQVDPLDAYSLECIEVIQES